MPELETLIEVHRSRGRVSRIVASCGSSEVDLPLVEIAYIERPDKQVSGFSFTLPSEVVRFVEGI